MSECIFCKIAAGEVPSKKVFEDDRVYCFRDINPQAPTHILVVPKRHVETLLEAEGDEALLGHIVAVATRLAREEGLAEGGFRLVWNCGAGAGQSVWHLHLHLLGGRPFGWPPG